MQSEESYKHKWRALKIVLEHDATIFKSFELDVDPKIKFWAMNKRIDLERYVRLMNELESDDGGSS